MGLVTAFLVTGFVVLRVVLEPRFFYWDDVQHTFAPVFYTIGEALRDGYWPATTPLLWQGGFLAGEGLYQLFNPVSLAVFAFLPSVDDIGIGMAIHAGVWLVIAALGVHVLALRLGSSPHWAVIAGLSYATSPFLLYWLAASWVNGAVAFAALPWALAFLSGKLLRPIGVLGLVASTYIVAVSGWIHAILALFLFGVARLLIPNQELPLRNRVIMGLGLAAGALLASPQLLATVAAVQGSVRPSNISNLGRAVADLQGLITLFWPAYVRPTGWFSDNEWSPPLYYAAWFILPAALLLVGRWRAFLAEFGWLVWPSLALIIATLGPEQFGTIRWPIRFLPAAWAVVIPLAAVVLSRSPRGTAKSNGLLAAVAVGMAALLTWQQNPGGVPTLVVLAVTVWALAMLVLQQTGHDDASRRNLACLGGTIFLVIWTAAEYPVNVAFDDYHGPARQSDIRGVGVPFPGSIVQIYSRLDDSGADRDRDCQKRCPDPWADIPLSREETSWVPTGNMPLWRRERLVNGYTPVEMLSLKTLTCSQSIFGWTCDGPGPNLLAREKLTQRPFADLMRIDAVVVSSRMPKSLAFFGSQQDWRAETESRYATVFKRSSGASALAGSLSYLPAGVEIDAPLFSHDDREAVVVRRPAGFTGGILAFARPWYPGYRAKLDGQRAPVERLGGVVVGVSLPSGEGPLTVEVRHQLPMPLLWRACVLAGLVCLIAGAILARRREPPARVT